MLAHEGCLIHGWVAVQKVAGNLHFSVRPEALFMSMNEAEIIGALLTRHMHLNVEVGLWGGGAGGNQERFAWH